MMDDDTKNILSMAIDQSMKTHEAVSRQHDRIVALEDQVKTIIELIEILSK